jgi:opacity protein-like surface antigen
LKNFLPIACLAVLMSLALSAHGQAAPAGERHAGMQIGAGWSIANPDYDTSHVQGLSIYGDLSFKRHLALEGDIHRASSIIPDGVGVDSYLVGPQFAFHRNRFHPYAKVLLGFGRFKEKVPAEAANTFKINAYTYKIFAFGGGLDYNLTRRINVRAFDFEYQEWPGYKPSGLTPYVYSFGAAYVF